MPTRTIVEELCDICFAEHDGEETPASGSLRFAWQGRDFLLLACEAHMESIRDALTHLSELATPDGQVPRSSNANRQPRRPVSAVPSGKTLFSQLGEDEKLRFRAWADMANARRIGDARVRKWIEAGKP